MIFYLFIYFKKKLRFDTDGFHAISSEKFLKRLTNEEFLNKSPPIPTSEAQDQQVAILKAAHIESSHSDSSIKTPRLNSKINLFLFSLRNIFYF